MKRADLHVDPPVWLKRQRDASLRSEVLVPTDDSADAEFTAYIGTAKHPKDHHEFAARAVVPGVYGGNTPPDVRKQLQALLDTYLNDHPNGLDNPAVTV